MRSFREYLTEAVLFEANVANVPAIDAFVDAYIKKTALPQGKAWLKKKLRTFLINQPEYLTPVNPENIPSDLPDFAVQAMQRGEPVFMFDPQGKVRGIAQQIQHIVDWFDAMHATVQAGPDAMNDTATNDFRLTQKEVEKLPKINFEQATQVADAWFAHMGTRLRGQKKEMTGVEVVMTWQDGYYAVRYTDAQVMKMDGRDLQNCLQHGNYWSQVSSGSNQVFGIRKPNDEAVVGMRTSLMRSQPAFSEPGKPKVQNWELVECKGKANKPPSPQYIPYVVDFLKQMKNIDIEGNDDLERAGVFYRNGNFGTFDDIAEVLYQKGNVKVSRSDVQLRASIGSDYLTGNIAGNKLTSVDMGGVPVEQACKLLQLSGLVPTPNLVSQLRYQNVFFQDGKYGTARDVGKPLGKAGNIEVYQVAGRIIGFQIEDGEYDEVISVDEEDGRLTRLHDRNGFDGGVVADVLNLTKIPPDRDMEHSLANDNLFFNGQVYGYADEIGQQVADINGQIVYALGKNRWAILDDDYMMLLLAKGGVLEPVNKTAPAFAPGIRWIALNGGIKKVANGSQYGVLNLKGGKVVADRASFFANLQTFATYAQDTSSESIQYAIHSDVREAIIKAVTGFFQDSGESLTPKEAAAMVQAFRPDPAKPLAVKEEKEIKLHDLMIKRAMFMFPMMLPRLFSALGAKVPKEAVADMKLALKQAAEFLKTHPHVNVDINLTFHRRGQGITNAEMAYCGLDAAMSKLQDIIADHKKKSEVQRKDRMNNFDKYADNNISNRFAALNAMNKLKGR